MKVVKKTAEYTIMKRRDNRHAIIDSKKNTINGDAKKEILCAEGLIKILAPKVKPDEKTSETEASTPDEATTE